MTITTTKSHKTFWPSNTWNALERKTQDKFRYVYSNNIIIILLLVGHLLKWPRLNTSIKYSVQIANKLNTENWKNCLLQLKCNMYHIKHWYNYFIVNKHLQLCYTSEAVALDRPEVFRPIFCYCLGSTAKLQRSLTFKWFPSAVQMKFINLINITVTSLQLSIILED